MLCGKRKMPLCTVFFGAAGLGNRWHSASDHSSPLYTSDWEQLPIAKAK